MINAKNVSKQRELTPAGNYVARCYQMIELGTAEENFMGETKIMQKVRIGWEFPTELKVFNPEKGEQPIVISKEYTLSMHEKASLRKDLESWRGKAFSEKEANCFDITKLIGAACMINLIHKPSEKDPSKLYERISSITPTPKGLSCPKQINPTFVISFDEFDESKFNTLPDFIKDRIKISNEYKKMIAPEHIEVAASTPEDDETSDMPF